MDATLLSFGLLVGVLGFAALASLFLRLPVVPLYIAAGLALGGFIPTSEVVEFLGSLGIAFLLFSMGLEFSLGARGAALPRIARAGLVDLAVNFPLGLAVGRALGWSWQESLFLAGISYMTSTAVVTKCVVDFGRAARPETEAILGIMVFEDLAIALYLVLLNALYPSGDAALALHPALALARSALFVLVLLVSARRLQVPLERILATTSDEAFTLLLFAFVLLVAALARAAGLSPEIGAFLGGLVLGGTGLKERSAATLLPFQTLFAALFFVSFGMRVDTRSFGTVLLPAALFVLVGFTTKTLGGFLAGRVAGHSPRQSVVVGLSLVPKGEFSVVLASLAAAAMPGSPIESFAGLYVLALSILGPLGMREADRLRDLIFPRRARVAGQRVKARSASPTPAG